MPGVTQLIMPAEWEPHAACLMQWPCRAVLWGGRFGEAHADYAAVARAVSRFEPVVMVCPPGEAGMVAEWCGVDVLDPGPRAEVSYANHYLANGAVIAPVSGLDDAAPLARLAEVHPDREIVPVPDTVIALGGGPHCITQQIPAEVELPEQPFPRDRRSGLGNRDGRGDVAPA